MDYNLCDLSCPFNINNNNSFTSARNLDSKTPLNLEDNGSKILLVFEAPGYYEWENETPIYDSRNEGMLDSAGSRIAKAFEIYGKNRDGYDIAEAVSCFPGARRNLIHDEICRAAYYCKNFLMNYISTKRYSRIICWGYIAHNSVVDVVGAIQTKDPMYCPDITTEVQIK